jgi:membrane protein YdbS with pleckstrin-like domain
MNDEFIEHIPDHETSVGSPTSVPSGLDGYDEGKPMRNQPTEIKEGITIYPHTGIAIIEIAKVWFVVGLMIAGLYYAGAHVLPPDLRFFANLGCFLLVVASALFALHRILHYTNTYVEITKDALIYRRGWVPHTIDTIFWVHIKDLNSSASVTESILKTGTVKVIVAIRTSMALVEINYLPKHEEFATFIRERIGKFSEITRQVTYT